MLEGSFEIVIEGEIDPIIASELAPALITSSGGSTTLRAERIDQIALHGILDRLFWLNLSLVGVTLLDECRPATQPDSPPSGRSSPSTQGEERR